MSAFDATEGPFLNEEAFDLEIDQLEDKPWRRQGEDITDYFNYGFTEDTWRMYALKQRQLRGRNSVNTSAATSNYNKANSNKHNNQQQPVRKIDKYCCGG